ncbi:TetR/AcrR family transcriptional regulator [Roseomonas sp. CAU 1739]|uniref:TetR/AcrR family transcriptional regulator n=1 Tax=Roseomonas sp. CAU 1739 TaxID=3140364 RepID=UPI00325B5FC7
MSAETLSRPYRQVARAAATEDTRRRIVAAFAAAIEQCWLDEITLDEIAAAAGTTRQTVIRLFGGKDGLLDAVAQRIAEEVELRRAVPPDAAPEAIAHALVEDYEATGDTVLRMLAQEGRHPALGRFLARGRSGHRAWVEQVFTAFLAARPAMARRLLIDQFVIVTDVYAWKLLRRDAGRSRTEAEAAIAAMIAALTAEGSSQHV